jgi:chitodextrinase
MKLKAFIYVLFILTAVSCEKKEYPKTVEIGDSEYYMSANINGEPVNIQAGKDNYYLYTGVEMDSNNVRRFKGDLRLTDCSGCTRRLQVLINDVGQNMVTAPSDSALMSGYYNYIINSSKNLYQYNFGATVNKTSTSMNWDFGDGTTSINNMSTHLYNAPGKYNICVRTKSSNGCSAAICNTIEVGTGFLFANVYSNGSGNVVSFNQVTLGGSAPYTYLWSFGDGSTSTQPYPSHSYKVAGSYAVTLRITDSKNKTAVVNHNAITGNDNSSCSINYTIATVAAPRLNLKKVEVKWTDASGTEFTSVGIQPNSQFQIVSSEDGGVNEAGQPIRKIRLKFSCVLYNGGSVITIDNADAVFAVAKQ